ncbi:hypothetical protein BH11MYX4_BH11MYX4_22230 [soil metagenome]
MIEDYEQGHFDNRGRARSKRRRRCRSSSSTSIASRTSTTSAVEVGALFRAADEQVYRAKKEGRSRAYVGGKTLSFDDGVGPWIPPSKR